MLSLCLLIAGAILCARGLLTPLLPSNARTQWLWLAALCFTIVGIDTFLRLDTHRILAVLAMPAGLLWLAWLAAMAVSWALASRSAAVAVTIGWVLYSLIGNPILGTVAVRSVEKDFAAFDPFESTYDAVIVLGGGTSTHQNTHHLGLSGDRVMLGARLWHTGRTSTLVTTGSTGTSHPHAHDSALITKSIWQELGIPSESILTESSPTNTREELEVIARLIDQHQWKTIGLITSARHLPRAMQHAERWQVRVAPLPADFRGGGAPSGLGMFVPSGVGFFHLHTAAWEGLAKFSGR